MRALFSLSLTFLLLFLFGISSFVAAQKKNEFWIGVGRVRFFDWTVNTINWEFCYTRLLSDRIAIHTNISYVGYDLHSSGFYFEDFSTGDVYSRDDWLIDVSFGYKILELYHHKLMLEGFGGPSFISGYDLYFDYLINNSFGEVSVTGKYRNDLGGNLGVGLKYFPTSRLSIGVTNKLHVFTNPPADFTTAITIGVGFGDPHFKKTKVQ